MRLMAHSDLDGNQKCANHVFTWPQPGWCEANAPTFCLIVVMKDRLWDFFKTPLELCNTQREQQLTTIYPPRLEMNQPKWMIKCALRSDTFGFDDSNLWPCYWIWLLWKCVQQTDLLDGKEAFLCCENEIVELLVEKKSENNPLLSSNSIRETLASKNSARGKVG